MTSFDDRDLAEQALRHSEARYRGLFENSSELIYRFSTDGIVLEVNPATTKVTGFSVEEMAGRPFHDFLHPDDLEVAKNAFRAALAFETGHAVIRVRKPDGSYVFLDTVNNPEVQEGKVVAVFGTGRDITETREAMEQLRERERLLSTVLDTLPIGVAVVDPDGRIVRSTPAGDAIWGFHRTQAAFAAPDVYRAWWSDSGEPVDPSDWASARALRDGTTSLNEMVDIEAADGTRRVIMNSAAPLIGESGEIRGVVVLNQDVTDRRRHERELQRAQRLASIGQLAATVAHEFNNVLMGILPFMEVIDRRSENDGDLRTMVRHVQQSLQRGKQITREILKFAQAPEPEPRPTRLRPLLEAAMTELDAIAGRRIVVRLGEIDERLAALVDATQVHQALSNLVTNARDAMNGEGTITIEAAAARTGELRAVHGAEWVCISVTDSGSGIEPADLERIFEPMFTTKRAGGTGLGLAVVQQVVTKHGGVIEVDSTVGTGSRFRLYFRRCAPPDDDAAVTSPAARHKVQTLLLVEDDENVSAGLQAVLELAGITTHLVTRGSEAEEAVARLLPDAVVLDRGLPDMDGLEVSRRLLERWPDLPIVFSTGHGGREIVDETKRHAHVAYLLKPYSVEALLALLDEIVAGNAT